MNLLFFLLFCCLAVCTQADRHAPRLKAGRKSFSSRLTRGTRFGNGKSRATLSLSSTEKNVELELEPNDDLLSADYEEIEVNALGNKNVLRRRKDMQVCWFHGKVVGDENSDVLVSDCNGEGFQGLIRRGNGKSYIAKSTGKDQDAVEVFATDDEEATKGSCGVDHDHDHVHHDDDHDHHHEVHSIEDAPLPRPPAGRRILASDSNVNVVEIALVSDKKYILSDGGAFGRNLTAVGERNIQIMNLVQATYLAASFAKPTSIRLKAQYFFSNVDPYLMTPDANGEVDANTLLSKFRDWSLSLPAFDHVHLMSDYDFQGNTVGLAYVGGACTGNKVGMSMMGGTLVQVANTVAHELGHSLGMTHDGGTTGCAASGFLMASLASCPSSGLCPISSCSIASKNAFTSSPNCLNTWNEASCTDGIMNGDELGVDCGGSCAPCGASKGCAVNNGGCDHTCTPLGSSYVCECKQGWYLDTVSGTRCIEDINQCLSNPCQETCTNTVGPGDSYFCSCSPPKYLSLFDGKSCEPESCFDRRKNQNEVMIDCGGVCARKCTCLVSTAATQYSYDRGFALTGAKWQSWDDSNKHQLLKSGVPIKYVYKQPNQWTYGSVPDSTAYGVATVDTPLPYSGSWQMYTGSGWVNSPFTFTACPAYSASTCGNGKVEGGEECDSCLVFENGKCLKANPCCDSTCLAPRLRGTACSLDGAPGACWDGSCVTRGASCDVITGTALCFGSSSTSCNTYTGGQTCEGVYPPPSATLPTFTASACTESFFCYDNSCVKTTLSSTTRLGPIRGYPCSAPDANGRYPFVCDGGPSGTGKLSTCVSVESLIDYPTSPSDVLTVAPTPKPTPKPTARPTLPMIDGETPVIMSPPPTGPTTRSPTTKAPTAAPTQKPTMMPTLRPTKVPTRAPTTKAPATQRPTRVPTMKPSARPTRFPTTRVPSMAPTLRPTRVPTLKPTAKPTRTPTTKPTRVPTSQPTARPTRVPTIKPTARPTRVPTIKPTARPTREPTSKPTRRPSVQPTRKPTRLPTSRPTTRMPTARS